MSGKRPPTPPTEEVRRSILLGQRWFCRKTEEVITLRT